MNWTNELPTEPGWYWQETISSAPCPPEVVRIVKHGDRLSVWEVMSENDDNLAYCKGYYRWSGPLTPPPTEERP